MADQEGRNMLTRDRGFTILELMITIAIVSIVTMIALPEASVWLANSKTRTIAEGYMNGLQIARNEAIKRNIPIQFEIQNTGGWTVSVVSTNEVVQKSVTGTSASIKFSVIAKDNKTKVIYNGLGALVDSGNAIQELDFSPTSISTGKSTPVRVVISNPSGSVKMCLPSSALPTGDPRKC
ncbi:type IV fimbrial biogenesis protein FimT [Chitinivorax tropicus]|uniref:Type II secretion system protein H n=1 Tax=Chitinivorax tropicus TaxID=714531 RepID=A0A840MXC1_9PROT|nr:GspH/FimT family pseudopilin [Chitinivorax tropicus]MBB5019801.1 type IV fimbrial biogenesis protein FimT [Chitinivorax tropicus]